MCIRDRVTTVAHVEMPSGLAFTNLVCVLGEQRWTVDAPEVQYSDFKHEVSVIGRGAPAWVASPGVRVELSMSRDDESVVVEGESAGGVNAS